MLRQGDGQEIGVKLLHGLQGGERGGAGDHRALGGGGEHLDVGVGTLRKIRHDGADWSEKKERERGRKGEEVYQERFFFVSHKRDTDVSPKPQELAAVGDGGLDSTNYS